MAVLFSQFIIIMPCHHEIRHNFIDICCIMGCRVAESTQAIASVKLPGECIICNHIQTFIEGTLIVLHPFFRQWWARVLKQSLV